VIKPSLPGSQAVILNMQHDRSSEATTVAADCCSILQPVLRRYPLSLSLSPSLTAAADSFSCQSLAEARAAHLSTSFTQTSAEVVSP